MSNFNRVLLGDVREQLDTLDPHSVHCVVTSPPYWALRDYGVDGQLGLEATPAEYIANQIDVFKRVHRVLRPDGVLWVNLGDTYSEAGKSGGSSGNKNERSNVGGMPRSPSGYGLQGGSQMLIPHRFAIAMQDAGWLLRSTVIWGKRSPMPESVIGWRWRRCRVKVASVWGAGRPHPAPCAEGGVLQNRRNLAATWADCPGCDKCRENNGLVLSRGRWRPTTGHEYVFQFVKSMNYFSDGEAASEPVSGAVTGLVERRNPRTIWMLSTEPLREKHFAAFPTALPRKCIEASTSAAGCCPHCGSQWAPVVESSRVPTRPGTDSKVGKREASIECGSRPGRPSDPNIVGNRDPQRHVAITKVIGYRATCACSPHEPIPCKVLDPYAGSGTTLQVAHQLGRHYLGIELNPDYLPLIEQRIKTPLPVAKKSSGQKRRKRHKLQLALFQ